MGQLTISCFRSQKIELVSDFCRLTHVREETLRDFPSNYYKRGCGVIPFLSCKTYVMGGIFRSRQLKRHYETKQ